MADDDCDPRASGTTGYVEKQGLDAEIAVTYSACKGLSRPMAGCKGYVKVVIIKPNGNNGNADQLSNYNELSVQHVENTHALIGDNQVTGCRLEEKTSKILGSL